MGSLMNGLWDAQWHFGLGVGLCRLGAKHKGASRFKGVDGATMLGAGAGSPCSSPRSARCFHSSQIVLAAIVDSNAAWTKQPARSNGVLPGMAVLKAQTHASAAR